MSGKLLLLPNLLDEELKADPFLPVSVNEAVPKLNGLIAESEKSARRYLRRFVTHEQMQAISLRSLNEHTPKNEIQNLLEPIKRGEIWGLISDAGLPCIADPGADLVYLANTKNIHVETFVGPCSIILALQLSGFSGQNFAFHGYLPKDAAELERKIKEMEKQAKSATQIWIEAPYRSSKMLELLKNVLQPNTLLCVAKALTSPTQKVASMPISAWKKTDFDLQKEPAIFLIS